MKLNADAKALQPDIGPGLWPVRDVSVALAFLGVVVLACILMYWRFVGFLASDDNLYLAAAQGWLEHFPYVGKTHWALRDSVTIPMALSVALFGTTEFAVVLPTMCYFLAFLALQYVCVVRLFGDRAGAVSAVLALTCPQILVLATYANSDMPELFFSSATIWSFLFALRAPGDRKRWVLCGALAALAVLTRETAASFVIFALLLFLFRPIVKRSRYFVLVAGFVPIILGQWLYLTVMTRDPLYRLSLDLNHDAVRRGSEVARVVARGGIIDGAGSLSTNVYLDPIVNLLVTQKYALLFWLAIPACVWVMRRAQGPQRRDCVLLVGFSLVYFLFVAANPKLYLIQRYFVVPAAAMIVVVAVWLTSLWTTGRRRIFAAALAIALGANLAALSVENTNPRYAERQLVRFVRDHPTQTIHTDPETGARAETFFRFANVSYSNVSTAPPVDGSIVFYNGDAIRGCAQFGNCTFDVAQFRKGKDWRLIGSIAAPPRASGALIATLHVDRAVPPEIARKLLHPTGDIEIYRVGQ